MCRFHILKTNELAIRLKVPKIQFFMDYLSIDNIKHIVSKVTETSVGIGKYINAFIPEINNNSQKGLELCHIGKFLFLLNDGYEIHKLSEMPDFILKKNYDKVGLEHEILINKKNKKTEGTVQDFFTNAKREFQITYPELKFLANIWYDKSKISLKKNEYNEKKNEVNKVIYHFYKTGKLLTNSVIKDLSISPHTMLVFCPNSGACCVESVNTQDIYDAILKKEEKVELYIQKTNIQEQWLLIVIGGCGSSSYDEPLFFQTPIIINNSKFKKIYLLHDSNEKLYTLK